MIDDDRFFSKEHQRIGKTEWFAYSREGILGPFESKQVAQSALKRHIEHFMRVATTFWEVENLDGKKSHLVCTNPQLN